LLKRQQIHPLQDSGSSGAWPLGISRHARPRWRPGMDCLLSASFVERGGKRSATPLSSSQRRSEIPRRQESRCAKSGVAHMFPLAAAVHIEMKRARASRWVSSGSVNGIVI
jgi:hypothetical protein